MLLARPTSLPRPRHLWLSSLSSSPPTASRPLALAPLADALPCGAHQGQGGVRPHQLLYGRTRISARSFLEHPHVAPLGLSLAAVMYDATVTPWFHED